MDKLISFLKQFLISLVGLLWFFTIPTLIIAGAVMGSANPLWFSLIPLGVIDLLLMTTTTSRFITGDL